MREKELKKRAERGENDVKGKKKRFEHWQIIAAYLVIYDVFAVNFSYFLGLLLRFDFSFTKIPTEYIHAMLRLAPIYTVFCLAVFWVLKLYNSLWAFASYTELNHILLASIITTLFNVGITMLCERMPASYYIVGAVMQFCLITGIRFGYRYITLVKAYEHLNDASYPISKLYVSHVISYLIGYFGRVFRYVNSIAYENWGDERLWKDMQRDYTLYFIDLDNILGSDGILTESNKEKLEVLQNRGASFIGYTVENEEFKISALNILQEAGLSFIKIIYGCPYSERKELIASDEELERKVIEL